MKAQSKPTAPKERPPAAPLAFNGGTERLRQPVGRRFSLTMTGDCCPWEQALDALRAGRADEMMAAAKPFIAASDIRLMQWETPLSDRGSPIVKSGPNIRCPPVAIEVLRTLGIDTALLANNHIGDHGGQAVLETLRLLRQAGIRTVGAGATPAEAAHPLIVAVNGLSLAILNVAEHEFGTVSDTTPGCAALAPLANIRAIRAAAREADLVLVVVHGGHERLALPSPRMTDTYRAFVEAGAAAVINCHTHCPSGIEVWQNAPIIYSPGNFFFPWKALSSDHLNALWWIGYVPKLHFDKRGVYAVEAMPFRFDNQQLYALSDADQKSFWRYLAGLNRLLASDAVVRRYFEAWSAEHGSRYLGWIRDRLADWPRPMKSRKAVKVMMPVRNIFTCEAHHDMVSQYLRLVEEGRVAAAHKGWPAILKLQQPAWAEKHWQRLRREES